ncbi:MAG TPA: carbohydrate ABC transporter permease [Anaerolineae bacterium]
MMTTAHTTITQRPGRSFNWGRAFVWLLMILLILVTLFPLYWVARTALTESRMVFTDPTALWPPGFTLFNFRRVLGLVSTQEAVQAGGTGQTLNFFLFLRNSVIVATVITVGQVFFSATAAYAFARLRFPFRNPLFFIYISALMIPGIVTLIPNFILIRNLGWLNTFAGIIAPYFLMTPFAVFFLRQFFLGINREVEEAAKIDGASVFGIFWRIVLPISQPPLMTLGIITFITAWNEYLWPLVVGRDESVRVLTVALGVFRSQTPQGAPDWAGLMAGTTLAVIPTVLLFIFLGRRVLDSIQFTGFK